MRIAEVRAFVVANDLAGKVWNPKIRWTKKYAVLLEVVTEAGLSGIGECWCFDRTPDALVAFLASEVVPRVVGLDALDRSHIHRTLWDTVTLSARHGIMASALSGLDIALWDLAARQDGVPLYRLLGGTDGCVPVYASGGLYAEGKTPDRLAAELASFIDRGFRQVKFKVGAQSPDADAARVAHVRARLGDRPDLIIDGVYSYDASSAASFHDRVAGARLAAFQSPLPADDIAGMAWLVAERGVPVMALEAEYRRPIIHLLLERRAVAILQFALVACGGITVARDLLGLAAARNIPVSLEVSSTAVAQLAAFHFAAAHPGVIHAEYHMVHQALFDCFPFSSDAIGDGILRLPDDPGLGLRLPRDRLDRRL